MTTGSNDITEDPQRLLATTRELTRIVRRAQSGGWIALLVFGVLTLLAAPFYRYGPHPRHCGHYDGGAYVCTVYPTLALWYWPVALIAGYTTVASFYLRRSRRRGLGSRVQPYVGVGVLLGLLAAAWAVWAYSHPAFLAGSLHVGPSGPSNVVFRMTSPAGAIGVALLILAWIERAWLLAAVSVVYLAAVGIGVSANRGVRPSPWVFLPHLLLVAGILLVGAGVLAFVRHSSRPPAS